MLGDQTLLHMLKSCYIDNVKRNPRMTFLCLCVDGLYLTSNIDLKSRVRLQHIMRENKPAHMLYEGNKKRWWPAKEQQKRVDWIDSMIDKYK